VPFFPFTRDEAAVIGHRFLHKLSDRLRKPIDLDSHPVNLISHIQLSLIDAGAICKKLSEEHYMRLRELGARGLQNAVDGLADRLFEVHVNADDEVTEEINKKAFDQYRMQLHPVEDTEEIVVFKEAEVVAEEEL